MYEGENDRALVAVVPSGFAFPPLFPLKQNHEPARSRFPWRHLMLAAYFYFTSLSLYVLAFFLNRRRMCDRNPHFSRSERANYAGGRKCR